MLDQRTLLTMLRAAAEPTRLRVLALLTLGELSVKDLTRILNQSQPRISRHLKLLTEAGLVERARDGSWAYFQLAGSGPSGRLVDALLDNLDPEDAALVRDRSRAEGVKRDREAAAQEYFQMNAAEWDRIRSLHVSETEVEDAIRTALGEDPIGLLVDLGTGTGRMLELLSDRYERAIGIDINHTMLAYARGNLERSNVVSATVRHGDLYELGLADRSAEAVIMHQVLHFLAEPVQAVREAGRILAPGGRLIIVDFAPHALEFLRDSFAHQRLGFSKDHMRQWLEEAGLTLGEARDLPVTDAAAEGKLTVTIWTAMRPPSRGRGAQRDQAKVEVRSP